MQGLWVCSLVRELRSHKPRGMAKVAKKLKFFKFNKKKKKMSKQQLTTGYNLNKSMMLSTYDEQC